MNTTTTRSILSVCMFVVSLHTALADDTAFRQGISGILGGSDPDAAVVVSGNRLHGVRIIRRLYEANGFHPLWNHNSAGSLGDALSDIWIDGLTPGDFQFEEIVGHLQSHRPASLPIAEAVRADMLLTEAFLRAVYNLYFGKADPERLDPNINFTRSYEGDDPVPFLLESIAKGRIGEAFDWARPKNTRYQWLRQGMALYRQYQSAGGWDPIPTGSVLKPGVTDLRVAMLRKRLAVTGDLPADSLEMGNARFFDEALKYALEHFQKRHGIDADGIAGADTLKVMNVPVQDRIDQIRVNLERWRWIAHEAYDEFLVVDIAGFDIYWVRNGQVLWKEKIQVGKDYTQTPVFKGEIKYIEMNPTWTLPPSILNDSVIPALRKDPSYLDRKGYQLLTLEGERVNPLNVNWAELKGFPYLVRQPAGPDNALGLVKFLFPNRHYVYLHDTNHRELFSQAKRTSSSGCIRVRNPFDLAERLLEPVPGWTRDRIDTVVASGETTRVNLERPMRILIAYNTARVPSQTSQVHFHPDIYSRDARVLAALDGPFQLRARDAP